MTLFYFVLAAYFWCYRNNLTWIQNNPETSNISFREEEIVTSGKDEINSWMLALLAAAIISSIGTCLVLSPYAIFSPILLSNRMGSWDTMPTCDLSHCRFKSFKLLPSRYCRRTYLWVTNLGEMTMKRYTTTHLLQMDFNCKGKALH